VDLGITYYDTARSYVNGEEAVGCLSPSAKDRLLVTTKTGARGGKHCLTQLEQSLRTTRRDRIDVWMTHMLRDEREYEMCTALGGYCDIAFAAKQAGLVRATGASFHAPTEVILRAIEERAFDVVMFQLNLIGRETVFGSSIRSYAERLLPAARANGVGVVVMKVLAGGEMRHGVPALGFTADREAGRDELGGAIRYAAMNPDVSTAVVGMATSGQLLRNVQAVEGVDDSQLQLHAQWRGQAQALTDGECTRCGQCLGVCPEQIEIPKVFRLFDQQRFLGMHQVARFKYREMEVNASACSQCRKCLEVCPEAFDIASLLADAHRALAPSEAGPVHTTGHRSDAVPLLEEKEESWQETRRRQAGFRR
jgi:predicted aldo/keto reductase-like oxidoreductase